MAKRESRLPRIVKAGATRKATIGITSEVDSRLSYWARRRGVTRSALANQILDAGLPGLKVDDPGRAPGRTEAVA
jgi:hypothetical protein